MGRRAPARGAGAGRHRLADFPLHPMQNGLPERQYDQLELFSDAVVAIDGSKFKAVNSSDRNFTDLGNTKI